MEKDINRVRNSRQAIKRIEDKMEELTAFATRMNSALTKTPGKRSTEAVDGPWAALADYRNEYAQQLTQHLKEAAELEDELKLIRSPEVRVAMLRRYVDCQTIETIAEQMHYAPSWIFTLLKRGRHIYASEYGGQR